MSWAERAACRGLELEVFYPERFTTEAVERARRRCAGCPVRAQCLAEAMAVEALDELRFGIVGGLTPRERRALAGTKPRGRQRPRPPSVRAAGG